MKHLRRKRTTSTPTPVAPIISSPSLLSPLDTETPLYTRFATTQRAHDTPSHKPIVSGPIALAPRKQPSASFSLQRGPSLERTRDQVVAREKSKAALRREEEQEQEHSRRRDAAQEREREGAKEVRRVASNGEVLRAEKAHAEGSSENVRSDVRVDGRRVLLPVRKVVVQRDGAEKVERPAQSGAAGMDEPGRIADGRVLLPARKVTQKMMMEDLNVGETHKPTPFPSLSTAIPQATATAANSASDDWTDKFSTPKRLHAVSPALKISTSLSSQLGPHVADLSSRSPNASTAGSSQRSDQTALPKLLSNSGQTTGRPEDQVRVVGDRVLLPARKVSRRVAPLEPTRDGTRDREGSPTKRSLTEMQMLSPQDHSTSSTFQAIVPGPSTKQAVATPVDDEPSPSARSHPHAVEIPAPKPPILTIRPTLETEVPSEVSTSTGSLPQSATLGTKPCASSVSSTSGETNGRPPRRRKYSLLAAFGLPVTRSASNTDAGTHDDQPPPLASPGPPPPPSPPAPMLLPTQSPSTASDHAGIDSGPREHLPSNARRPLQDLQQLQSLHLSGFNFSLDAFLADKSVRAQHDVPPTPPHPATVQPPPSQPSLKHRTVLVSQPVPASSSEPPVVLVAHETLSARPSPSASQSSKGQTPSPTPPAPPTVVDLPAPSAPVPVQPQKAKSHPAIIDPDSSLLSPQSDTRYPLPSRRSPTHLASQTRSQNTSPPPNKASNRALNRLPSMKSQQPIESSNQPVFVQGRPLIFAAMAAAEADAEIIEPKAWMAVATFQHESQDGDVKPVQTEHSNGSSQFVNGYPTPRSTSPKLPVSTSTPAQNTTTTSLPDTKRGDDTRYTSSPPPQPQSPTASSSLLTPPETQPVVRARKLSKARPQVTRMTDSSQQVPQPHTLSQYQTNGHASNTLGAKPPTPVEDAPPARSRDTPQRSVSKSSAAPTGNGSSASALGSPFQIREKATVEKRSADASRSPPRVINSESPVPTRPVKVLTERQMEKLTATKGISMHSANGNGAPPPQRHPGSVKSPASRSKPLPPLQPSTSQSSNSYEGPPTPTNKRPEDVGIGSPKREKAGLPEPPRSPRSAEEYAQARSRRRGKALEKNRPEGIDDVPPPSDLPPEESEPKEPTFYPLEKHIAEPTLLGHLLPYLTFADWLALSVVSKVLRTRVHEDRELTECVLARFLRTVGYTRWMFPENEPLTLSLTDLQAYMYNVSVPLHQFARYAEEHLGVRDHTQRDDISSLQAACRSYTRVVLRLRAQAEAEARAVSTAARDRAHSPARLWNRSTGSVNYIPIQQQSPKIYSRSSSRAPSPTSLFSQSQHGHMYGHARSGSLTGQSIHHSRSHAQLRGANGMGGFHSPLFRLRRAPLLQVFVPSPEGDWLSDTSVLECEQDLKRAGVVSLLRPGDVVWDTAAGDEGNVGRLVWDGSYLIDLDYTYSRSGDLPKYLPTLAFPPSYFHRVIRTMGGGNPICHIDIAPWSEEIATNLQLLQDRTKAETPQGGRHMVVRWVHRSSFTVRPSSSGKPLRIAAPKCVGPGPAPGGAWLIDPGWFGTVIVEAEGTNEGLADLQERCRGAFPIRATGAAALLNQSPERTAREEEKRSVFRILREKSRPGEIWIRTVTDKERLLPP